MEYKSLKKIYYSERSIYEKEYLQRINGYGTTKTTMFPYLMKKEEFATNEYPLFVVPIMEIQLLSQKIIELSSTITALANDLPDVAHQQFYNEQLFNAIISTNEIEGIGTTRKDVAVAIEALNKDKKEWEITPGGKHLPHNGKVYLQPDPDLHTVEDTIKLQVGDPGGGVHQEEYPIKRYQKGLLTDERAGFNAYYLTDTPTLSKDTTKTYMTIRGSDAISLENWNDWIDNDAKFALNHIHTPQAKLATVGMKTKIAEMREKAPQATMDITGHSLGTIVSAQGVAGPQR